MASLDPFFGGWKRNPPSLFGLLYSVCLVCLVSLVCLVDLVSLVCLVYLVQKE